MIQTDQISIAPKVHNNEDEYAYSIQRDDDTVLSVGTLKINGINYLSISIDDDGTSPLQQIILPAREAYFIKDILSRTETRRRLKLP